MCPFIKPAQYAQGMPALLQQMKELCSAWPAPVAYEHDLIYSLHNTIDHSKVMPAIRRWYGPSRLAVDISL